MNDQLDLRPVPGRTEAPPLSKPVRRRRWVTPVGSLLVVLVAGFVAWKLLATPRHAAPAGRQGPGGAPQSVGVATIATGDVQVVKTGLGAVTPLATVTVKTQINGQLQQIAFTEGQLVRKGDFLAQIDPRPYEVALEQAQGTLAHDQGLLAQARADNARYQTLSRQDSISRQQVEDQVYLVKQYEGTVLADQGSVDSAKLNLAYCHIVSPVDGRIGIRLVDVGNYVQTSDSGGIVVVTQLAPISVLFTLPEDDVAQVRRQMAAGKLQVTAYDRTDTTPISTGTLATFDNQIDATTGTVKLRAMFDNADDALFPQQFVNARLLVQTLRGVVTAPSAAIQHGAPGDFVYLVKPDDTVAIQVVKTGVAQGGVVEVKDGLKPGDTVVVDGLDRLKDGAKVAVPGARGEHAGGRRGPGGGPAGGQAGGQGSAPAE